jgi:hypothetical protein
MHKAVLWMAQIVNNMAVVFLFPLAMRLKRSTWAGAVTLLIAGLLVPMPMYYVNWGRFTQLAGQAILPAAVCFAWAALEREDRSWRLIALTWLTLAGLALTHYRVTVFAVMFFVAYLVINIFQTSVIKMLLRTFVSSIGAVFLIAPWLVHLFDGRLPNVATKIIQESGNQITRKLIISDPIGNPENYLPLLIWLLIPLILGWRLWSRDRKIALLGIWWYLIYLAANPHMLNLPGTRLLTNFMVFIAAYIPASLLIGSAFGHLVSNYFQPIQMEKDESRETYGVGVKLAGITLLIIVIASALWGARVRLWDVDLPTHALVTHPDMRAYAWTRQNTPDDSSFLINSFLIYGDTAIVGADGGWWLPLLAHREVNVPPLNYTSEQGPHPEFHEWVILPTSEISNKGIDHPDVLALLKERNTTHIYIGQQQGRVNNNYVINISTLIASPHFTPIYHQDRVWIFKIIYPE